MPQEQDVALASDEGTPGPKYVPTRSSKSVHWNEPATLDAGRNPPRGRPLYPLSELEHHLFRIAALDEWMEAHERIGEAIVEVVRKGKAPEVSIPRWLGSFQALRVLAPPLYRFGLTRAVKRGMRATRVDED
jgi:hypothetical protein